MMDKQGGQTWCGALCGHNGQIASAQSSSYLCESLLQVQIKKKTMLMTEFDILGDQDSLVGSDLA